MSDVPAGPLARLVVIGGLLVVIVAGAAGIVTSSLTLLLGAFGLVALAAAGYLGTYASPALLISLALASEVLNGNAKRLGLPISPDRVLLVAALATMLLRLPSYQPTRSLVWRPVHALLAATAAYGVVSALAAHTLTTSDGIFALLDRLGIVPFLVFTIAPLVFGDRRARDTLLLVLVGLGIYLGVTALAEALGLKWLEFPAYIKDPNVGIHYGRARGPFVEAVADGLGLYGCAVASAIGFWLWKGHVGRRRLAAASVVLCLGGTIFTLTRAVWLATVVASLLALLANQRTRRMLAPTVGVGLVALAAAIFFVPGFAHNADERSSAQRPLWDRYNSNSAAVRAVEDHPLFGVGFQAWRQENSRYLRLSQDYPLTGTDIEIHNVALSHAAELGLVGLVLWGTAFVAGIGGAIFRPGPTELDPWRLGMVALAVHWLIVAAFGPLSYPFPNLLLWTWAGVCSVGHLSTRERAPAPAVALVPA
ncbi:MAG: O-antigen ligase protein [Actinomycetia bacterium]|nr:O-antigen ligase protein [Actinomycetes bacterium]